MTMDDVNHPSVSLSDPPPFYERAYLTVANVRKLIDAHRATLDIPATFPIRISFSGRMKVVMGKASYRTGTGTIQLSHPLFLRATPQERHDTILHELCHIAQFVALYRDIDLASPKGQLTLRARRLRGGFDHHGWVWGSFMRRVGLNPHTNVHHTVPLKGLVKRFPYTCGCPGCVLEVGPKHHRKAQERPGLIFCRACRKPVTFLATDEQGTVLKAAQGAEKVTE